METILKSTQNRIMLVMVVVALIGLFAGLASAQMLEWNANTEEDLLGYNVWKCPNESDTSSCILLGSAEDDVTTIETCYPLTPDDYDYYFRLTALDTTLNESGFSDYAFYDAPITTTTTTIDDTAPDVPARPTINRDDTCTSDLNVDGKVDFKDLWAFWMYFGQEFGTTCLSEDISS